MKVSEQIGIMIAYQDGKTIEQKRFDRTEWESIVYDEDFPFDFASYEYRIKPEDKYRPYESVEEAFADAKKHGFWIRNVDRAYLRFICSFHITKNSDIFLGDYSADYILHMFVWHDDNSPCGVKIN